MHHILKACGLALLLALGACAGPGSDLPPLPEPARDQAYRLGPDDRVRVTVFGETRMSGEFRIGTDGHISVPLLGRVAAEGLTTPELEGRVAAALRGAQLVPQAAVAVEVAQYRPIFVLGMVERSGQFPFFPGSTALSAIATAGGFNPRAVTERVAITRAGPDGRPREWQAPPLALLQPGDVVGVLERWF